MTVVLVDGRFDDAALLALCVDNVAPSWGELNTAKQELPALTLAASNFLFDYPVVPGIYCRQQEAFGYISRMMEAAGWAYCGAGYYSAAYFKGGLVIKIGFKPEDSALLYAAWCRANQGKAGVPVIHKLVSKGLGYAILMDRLEALAGELDADTPGFDPLLAAEFEGVRDTLNLGADGWGIHMELCRTAMAIREFFEDIANFDIHPGNVMLDRNGDLVITDPVSFVGDTLSGEGTETARDYGYRQAA